MFSKSSKSGSAERIYEEALYEHVFNELSSGFRREGLWAKAVAESDGVESKAKSLYLKYRVQSLKDEAELEAQIKQTEEAQRAERARSDAERKNQSKVAIKKSRPASNQTSGKRFVANLFAAPFIFGTLISSLVMFIGLIEQEFDMALAAMVSALFCIAIATVIKKD